MPKGRKTGGRQKGTPNKATAEAKEVCTRLVDDRVYLTKLRQRLRAGTLSPAVECMLWHFAKGKPREDLGVVNSPLIIRWESDERDELTNSTRRE